MACTNTHVYLLSYIQTHTNTYLWSHSQTGMYAERESREIAEHWLVAPEEEWWAQECSCHGFVMGCKMSCPPRLVFKRVKHSSQLPQTQATENASTGGEPEKWPDTDAVVSVSYPGDTSVWAWRSKMSSPLTTNMIQLEMTPQNLPQCGILVYLLPSLWSLVFGIEL